MTELKQIPDGATPILDKGYLRLVDKMGTDVRSVNAARASFSKEVKDMGPKDVKLLDYLIRNDEYAPLRHVVMTFEVYAPLMVARQWWKYSVSATHREEQLGWSESSRRYITEEPTFYVPTATQWRKAPENKKQGSGGLFEESQGAVFTKALEEVITNNEMLYELALKEGVAPEQARLFLPSYGMYVRWYYTASMQSILHFLKERLDHKAQAELQVYAQAIRDIVAREYPETYKAWLENRL